PNTFDGITLVVTCTGAPPPVANPSSATVPANSVNNPIPLDIVGGADRVDIVTPVQNGTLTVSGIDVSYTPSSGFAGTDTFNYTPPNDSGTSASATVTITVTSTNTEPVAAPDDYVMTQNTMLTLAGPGVLANDLDAEGDTLYASLYAFPAFGGISFN